MTNQKWELLSGDQVLGELHLTDVQQPFRHCAFRPLAAFEPFASIFEAEAAALATDDVAAWERAEAELATLNLSLVSSNGERIADPLIHVAGEVAWFRA
jgi:hypothetical protein